MPKPRKSRSHRSQASANLTALGSPALGAGSLQLSANNMTINYTAMPKGTLRFMLSQRHLKQTGPRRVLITRSHSSICAVFQWRTRWRTCYFKPWHTLASNVCLAIMMKPRTGLEGFWTLLSLLNFDLGKYIRAFPASAVSYWKYPAGRISRQVLLNFFKRILVIQSIAFLL